LTTTQVVNPGNLSLTLSSATGIENVVGSRYADTLYGNTRDNNFLGAAPFDGRFANPLPLNNVTQLVYLDFTYTNNTSLESTDAGKTDHVYTDDEKAQILARMTADYAA